MLLSVLYWTTFWVVLVGIIEVCKAQEDSFILFSNHDGTIPFSGTGKLGILAPDLATESFARMLKNSRLKHVEFHT